MKWIEALRKWNAEHNPSKWCVPRKGTAEHAEVKAMMGTKVEKAKAKAAKAKAEMREELKAVPIKKKKAIKIEDVPEVDVMAEYEKERLAEEVEASKLLSKKARVKAFLRKLAKRHKGKKAYQEYIKEMLIKTALEMAEVANDASETKFFRERAREARNAAEKRLREEFGLERHYDSFRPIAVGEKEKAERIAELKAAMEAAKEKQVAERKQLTEAIKEKLKEIRAWREKGEDDNQIKSRFNTGILPLLQKLRRVSTTEDGKRYTEELDRRLEGILAIKKKEAAPAVAAKAVPSVAEKAAAAGAGGRRESIAPPPLTKSHWAKLINIKELEFAEFEARPRGIGVAAHEAYVEEEQRRRKEINKLKKLYKEAPVGDEHVTIYSQAKLATLKQLSQESAERKERGIASSSSHEKDLLAAMKAFQQSDSVKAERKKYLDGLEKAQQKGGKGIHRYIAEYVADELGLGQDYVEKSMGRGADLLAAGRMRDAVYQERYRKAGFGVGEKNKKTMSRSEFITALEKATKDKDGYHDVSITDEKDPKKKRSVGVHPAIHFIESLLSRTKPTAKVEAYYAINRLHINVIDG